MSYLQQPQYVVFFSCAYYLSGEFLKIHHQGVLINYV